MATVESETKQEKVQKSTSPTIAELKFMAFRIRKSPLSLVGLFIIIFYALMAVSAPIIAAKPSWDVLKNPDPFIIPRASWSVDPSAPNALHPLGLTTEQYDVYYACVWGSITAFRVGVYVVALSLLIGVTVGLLAGYYGGLVDEGLMRFTDVIIAFPGLVLSIALTVALPDTLGIGLNLILPLVAAILVAMAVATSGPSRARFGSPKSAIMLVVALASVALAILSVLGYLPGIGFGLSLSRLDKVLIALVLVGWPGYTRVIRGEVMRTRNEDYVEAAKAIGCSDFRIMTRHIIPNAIYPILILASLDIGAIVLTAAALSFLGIGAPIDYADWGQIIQKAQNYMGTAGSLFNYWYIWIVPGIFIFIFGLGWNLLGDAIRDILDPTLRRR